MGKKKNKGRNNSNIRIDNGDDFSNGGGEYMIDFFKSKEEKKALKRSKEKRTRNNGNHSYGRSDKEEEKEWKKLENHMKKCSGISADSRVLQKALLALQEAQDESVINDATVMISAVPNKMTPRQSAYSRLRGYLLRSLLIDFPLWLIFALFVAASVLDKVKDDYLLPQLDLIKWDREKQARSDLTYYDRECSYEDMTASKTKQLLLPRNVTPQEATEHMLLHGAQIYQRILTYKTANALRTYVLQQNQVKESLYSVLEGENRYSWGVDVHEHPSIAKALREIGRHPVLRPALERIVGPDPAVIEFTTMTSTFGAKHQDFHHGVVPDGSAFKYARNFLPSYSLLVPLQDTNRKMGATEVCPGTHMCNDGAMCENMGLALSGKRGHWRKGDAALISQQLVYRGTAHTDDRFGSERVLLILTLAPRPRFDRLETRILGQDGSYSLLWNQWGHTLDDFSDSRKRMTEPFRTLRSLGLYKPSEYAWGWDYVSVSSMRIANHDNGFRDENLIAFVHKQGGFPFLPDELQAQVQDGTSWTDFLVETSQLCVSCLLQINAYALAVYLFLVVFVDMVSVWKRSRNRLWRRVLVRLLVTHGATVLVGYRVWCRVESSAWARNIRYGRAFRGYRQPQQAAAAAAAAAPKTQQNATLPFDTDVLVDTRYSSLYMGSYKDVLDGGHPGNLRYQRYLANHLALGYNDWTPAIQRNLCEHVVNWVHTNAHGRFLTQTDRGDWVRVMDPTMRVHHDLAKLDGMGVVMATWDHLMVETKVGPFRETVLAHTHTQRHLEALSKRLIGTQPPITTTTKKKKTQGYKMRLFSIKKPKCHEVFHRVNDGGSSGGEEEPPYLGAWVKVGDVVDGRYHSMYNEWYRGVVTSVDADDASYTVLYDDGEIDPHLGRGHVRPFEPYRVDEPIAVRRGEEYHMGRITKADEGGVYRVRLSNEERTLEGVPGFDLRRFDFRLHKGTRVEARFRGISRLWFKGRITRVHRGDGTLDIAYDDGDVDYELDAKHVRIIEQQ